MNKTILIIFVFFVKTIFLAGFWPPADPSQPARMDYSNHFLFFFKPSLSHYILYIEALVHYQWLVFVPVGAFKFGSYYQGGDCQKRG